MRAVLQCSTLLCMDIISRQDALSADLKRYFTGKPCKNGHISERYTEFRTCVKCLYENNAGKAAFNAWNSKRLEAEDEARLSQRILDEKGPVAWAEWMLKKATMAAEEAKRRDASNGRWHQYLDENRCRHLRTSNHPDGRTLCRDCDAEVPAPKQKKRKTPKWVLDCKD